MAEYDRCRSSRFILLAGNGRRPYPLETMLRLHCMQHWYNLSDGAMEDAPYEIAHAPVCPIILIAPADRTTIMKFPRHLLEQHNWLRNCSRPSIAGWPKQAS